MWRSLFALTAAFSLSAAAAVYQLPVGEHQNLNNGDVAIVTAGGRSSTISCTGGNSPGLPARKRFQYTHFAPYEQQTMQIYPEQTLMSNCQRYASLSEPKQAIAFATSTARELCFEQYQTCTQPGREAEQYYFNYVGRGRKGCEVTAFYIGENPRD